MCMKSLLTWLFPKAYEGDVTVTGHKDDTDAAVLSGKWRFNDRIDLSGEDIAQAVNFTTIATKADAQYTLHCSAMKLNVSRADPLRYEVQSACPEDDTLWNRWEVAYMNAPSFGLVCFCENVMREVDFGEIKQAVSGKFFRWFIANAIETTREE